MFLGPIGKTRWPPWPLIGWVIFDFSSETAERNSTKLDRKQDLNVLYQVCVFRADRKNKMAALASDWLRHFWLFLWNRWTEINETWQEARFQRLLPSLCFSGRWVNKNFRPGRSVKKVAHCTQVHDMWPFGPLVSQCAQQAHWVYSFLRHFLSEGRIAFPITGQSVFWMSKFIHYQFQTCEPPNRRTISPVWNRSSPDLLLDPSVLKLKPKFFLQVECVHVANIQFTPCAISQTKL